VLAPFDQSPTHVANHAESEEACVSGPWGVKRSPRVRDTKALHTGCGDIGEWRDMRLMSVGGNSQRDIHSSLPFPGAVGERKNNLAADFDYCAGSAAMRGTTGDRKGLGGAGARAVTSVLRFARCEAPSRASRECPGNWEAVFRPRSPFHSGRPLKQANAKVASRSLIFCSRSRPETPRAGGLRTAAV